MNLILFFFLSLKVMTITLYLFLSLLQFYFNSFRRSKIFTHRKEYPVSKRDETVPFFFFLFLYPRSNKFSKETAKKKKKTRDDRTNRRRVNLFKSRSSFPDALNNAYHGRGKHCCPKNEDAKRKHLPIGT